MCQVITAETIITIVLLDRDLFMNIYHNYSANLGTKYYLHNIERGEKKRKNQQFGTVHVNAILIHIPG